MNRTKTYTTMKKISRLSILLLGLFLALPLSAKWDTDIKELENALKCFINDKSVSLTDARIIARGQPIDKKSINVKETDWGVDFTCTDGELVISLWKELMGHLKNTSFFYCTDEFHPKTEPWKGLRLDNMEATLVLTGNHKNVYVLTFEDSDGWDNGFFLTWDDLPDGGKTGYLSRFIGKNPKLITLVTSENRITMDSVRTAIKVGETVKNNPKQEIDTTYIDGKWAVSAKYHQDVLRAMDHVSDYYDDLPSLSNKINELVRLSKKASETELASIGFALKREASRYERLLSPEEYALIWKGLYAMETKAKGCDPQIQDYFKASESILKGKVNESVRLEYHDTKRHQFLRDIGFTVTKNDGGRWYYAVSGRHYTGNKELEYLDACADEDGVLRYTAERKETNLKPGIYKLTAAARTSNHGNTGAFIFAKAEGLLLSEIPACDDRGGDIWRDAAIRVKEADEKGQQISPNDVRIALANGGMGYGWNKVVIDGIEVRDGKLTYGVSCDPDFTGHPFKGGWLSAVDFVLERVGDLPANEQQ